jgi:pSer/pThr/pTyr-binding forkhead associated (FHA) protein
MTDQILDILKLVLLALLYLFFARVLWAVWSEVRQPIDTRGTIDYQPPTPAPPPAANPTPVPAKRATKPVKGRGGTPARLVVLEPKERRGAAFAIGTGIGIGRESGNAILITDDTFISGHHARVAAADGFVVVDDLGSRNGTYLNGNRITQRRTVHVGDRIQVGYTVLEAQ